MTSSVKNNTAQLANQIQPVKMINRPTVVPTSGVEQPTMNVTGTDPYFSLTVDTSGLTEATDIILFDTDRSKYQMRQRSSEDVCRLSFRQYSATESLGFV